MNFRFTAFLFVGVVALVVALLVLNLTDAPPRLGAGLLEPLAVAGVTPEQVETVEIARTEPVAETLVFARLGASRWELREPHRAKADGAALDALVKGLFQAKPTRYDGLTGNLAVHGLDKPVKITLKGGGAEATVAVGLTTLSGANSSVTFVTSADRPTVPVAVPTQNLHQLFRDAPGSKVGAAANLTKRGTHFRQLQLLPVTALNQGADLAAVSLTHDNKATAALARQKSGGWAFTAPANYGDADTQGDANANPDVFTGVQPLLSALEALRPNSVDDYIENVPEAEFSKYGVAATDPGVLRIEVKPADGPAEVLFVGKSVPATGPTPGLPRVYARLDGDPGVVPVPASSVKMLAQTAANPSLMRNRDLIARSNLPRIDAADVTVGGTTFRLRKVGTTAEPKWALYGGPIAAAEASSDAVAALLNAACAPRAAADVLTAPNDAAFAPAEVKGQVKLYLDALGAPAPLVGGKPPPEPTVAVKDAAPPVTLIFGQTTPTGTHVRRLIGTGPPTDFLLPPAPLVALAARPRLSYLQPDVGSFSLSNVARVTATRAAEPAPVYDLTFTEVEKLTELEKGWFPRSEYLLGKTLNAGKPASHTAAQQVLAALAGLEKSTPVAEAPPDPELATYGLKPARLTVTVTLKGADPAKPRVYEFGNDSPNAGKVYFRADGKLMVLETEKFIVDTIEKADLRDPVVQRVDRTKHNRIDFYWKAATGQTDELYLVPGPKAAWTVAQPAGFKADLGKVEALAKLLELPPKGTFVDGPEKPDYKLNGDVFVAVFNRAPEQPVTIYLGAEDETRQFVYAKSSETPGVVKLPAAPFRPFLTGRESVAVPPKPPGK